MEEQANTSTSVEGRPAETSKPMTEARKKAIEAMIRGKQAYEERRKMMMASIPKQPVSEPPSHESVVETKKKEEKQDAPPETMYEFVRVPKMVWEDKLQRIEHLTEKARKRKLKLQEIMTIKHAPTPQFLTEEDDEENEVPVPPRKVRASPLNYNENDFFAKRDTPAFSMPSSRILNMNALDNPRAPQGVNRAMERTLRDKIKGR